MPKAANSFCVKFTWVGRAHSRVGFVTDLPTEGCSTPTHRHFRPSRRECGLPNVTSPLIFSACGNGGQHFAFSGSPLLFSKELCRIQFQRSFGVLGCSKSSLTLRYVRLSILVKMARLLKSNQSVQRLIYFYSKRQHYELMEILEFNRLYQEYQATAVRRLPCSQSISNRSWATNLVLN